MESGLIEWIQSGLIDELQCLTKLPGRELATRQIARVGMECIESVVMLTGRRCVAVSHQDRFDPRVNNGWWCQLIPSTSQPGSREMTSRSTSTSHPTSKPRPTVPHNAAQQSNSAQNTAPKSRTLKHCSHPIVNGSTQNDNMDGICNRTLIVGGAVMWVA